MKNNFSTILLIVAIMVPGVLIIGQLAATDQTSALAIGVIIIGLMVFLKLGKSAWLLLPLTHAFSHPVSGLPGGFALRDIVIGLVFAFLCIRWLGSRFRVRFRLGILEAVLIVQFLFVLQVYLRNPAGLSILGSSTVGGRPYIEIVIAGVSFLVLSSQVVSLQMVKRAIYFLLFGGLASAALELFSALVPAVGIHIARFYRIASSGIVVAGLSGATPGEYSLQRRTYLFWLVKPLFGWLMAIARPLQVLNPTRPLMVIALCIVIVAVFASGFRSLIVWCGMMYVAAAFAHQKIIDIFVAGGLGLTLVIVAIGGNGALFDLPLTAQRALSFLPGEWDPIAKNDAEASTNWRLQMWETVLTSDKYIENKTFGDGYTLNPDDLVFQQRMQESAVVSDEMIQEHFMRSGDYHSGPIQTINRVGYVGLIALTIGFVFFVRSACKMIRRARGTEYQVAALFVGLPVIVYPFFFYLVIGGHAQALQLMCFYGGLLRLLENSMDETARLEQIEHETQDFPVAA